MRLLRTQAAVRGNLGTFLECRAADNGEAEVSGREQTPAPPSEDSARLKSAMHGLSRTFADQQKALDLLSKLR